MGKGEQRNGEQTKSEREEVKQTAATNQRKREQRTN